MDAIATQIKKIAFKKIAEMSQDELELIYELTYKYGWLVAEERQEGWLPDRAYLEKAKIEGELLPWIDYGLDELLSTYDDWLSFHRREDWIETMMESRYTIGGVLSQFAQWNKSGMVAFLDDRILDAAWDALGGADAFREDVHNVHGEAFIESFIENLENEDPEQAETLAVAWEEQNEKYPYGEGAEDFIYNNHLEKEFEEYTADYGTADWFRENFSVDDLPDIFPQLMENPDFFSNLYDIYLDIFPGLGDEINAIDITKDDLERAEDGTLQDKIITFQLGLNTAHHHGVMADHLLGVNVGTGEGILDTLSSGPNLAKWNRDLEQIIGFKSTPETSPEYFTPASKLISSIGCLQRVLEDMHEQ